MKQTRTDAGATVPMPSFTEFYRAINGREPFPWQARLARCLAATGRWPEEIGIPTGLGKTACLDIAVWWLATQADHEPEQRSAPTRIWWVVNRRLLVDSTAEHAESIAEALRGGGQATGADGRGAVACVAHRLRSLCADPAADPLEVIRLRGGITPRTPTDPSQPTILLCTLPMYGSRLLFRGYGSRLRAVDAAMAGTDSLVLLDEAHLAPHLRALAGALPDCMPGAMDIFGGPRSRPGVVALTATGDAGVEHRFDLDDDDKAHPIVRQRLHATKPLELLREESSDSARHLADATLGLVREATAPAAYVVFANTPKTARQTFKRLHRQTARGNKADVLLLTGLAREREAERIRARILDPEHGMAASRSEDIPRERHLIVVATQTLEVGADIDAEYLVTEACGVRALTQRLGRVNRLGRYAHARAIYIHMPSATGSKRAKGTSAERGNTNGKNEIWPVYGGEPKTVLDRLQDTLKGGGAGTVDVSPARVGEVLGPPCDTPGRAPELLPGILWEWTKTTTPPEGEAPVEPYFSGITRPDYRVSLIWRVHVPGPDPRLWPRATDREAVEVPIGEVRKVLGDDQEVHRLASDSVTTERTPGASLRPGDRVVLPADRGLLDAFGWNPDASDPVMDVSLPTQGLPLDAASIERLCGVRLGGLIDTALGIGAEDDIDPAERDAAVEAILSSIRAVDTPPGWIAEEWQDFTGSLSVRIEKPQQEVPRLRVMNPAPEPRIAEFEETSLGAGAVALDQHGDAVAERARAIANRIGLPSDLKDVVERAAALHDIGKADPRFQRWLDPDEKRTGPVAKSSAPRHRWEAMRVAAGWPRGGRHEDLSARLVRAWLAEDTARGDVCGRDLLIHLVIAHHGKGRPLVLPVSDDTYGEVCAVVAGTSVRASADLSIVDWDQPARFRRLTERFGLWGLALLEAIVIRADHAVSAAGDAALETL